MFSEFKTYSFMGVSNSEMFLSSEKDLNTLEINFLARPTLGFQDEFEISPQVERELFEKREDHTHLREDQAEDKCKILVSSLKIKLPSLGEFQVEEGCDDEGFKTPTSSDQKVQIVLQCPPAPRKPKSRPLLKRNVSQRRIHDLSNEVTALFPPALLADFGNKIKKVKQETDTKL